MEASHRNQTISDLLDIWEWCSATLHVKWKRKRKSRNSCLMALGYAITEPNFISPFRLPKVYKTLPTPLLNQKKVGTFWDVQPVPLLELCLGSFTKSSPLKAPLDRVRHAKESNLVLDKLVKQMRARQTKFGSNWYLQGHHPESEFEVLQKETAPLCTQIRTLALKNHVIVNKLALEVLAQGPWQFGQLPAASFVRKTPETLLNRATRLRLWEVAQEVLSRELDPEETVEAMCRALGSKITASMKSAIESQGYTADQVVDDVLNFDMYKSRKEVTS